MSANFNFLFLFLVLVTLALAGETESSAECAKYKNGCTIEGDRCVCGYGCVTEYRFNNRGECLKAIRGGSLSSSDICDKKPCRNNGSCSQIAQEPRFVCRCEGTGFYGKRCQYECPKPGVKLQGEFPYECIII